MNTVKAIALAIAFSLVMSIPILLMRLHDNAQRRAADAAYTQRTPWDLENMPNEEPVMPNPNDPRLHVKPQITRYPHVSN
jgi:hypothetical protein